MGAGRRTETVSFNNYTAGAVGGAIKVAPQRKLAERGRLGSVIFGCTNATYSECVTNKLFGLPYSHHSYVEHIDPGMPLFLFNYNDRKMHGIFEAVSEGALNINSYAWTGGDSGSRTQFPAQVRVQLRTDFTRIVSVPEVVFKDAIIDNYYSPSHFFFEVDSEQTERLIRLFERQLGNSSRQAPVVSKGPFISAPPANAWQTVGNTSKVWKKTIGSVETDEKLKMKKPAIVIMSEWEKGAQYVSSSSKEADNSESRLDSESRHQESAWMNSNHDEDSDSEASEESPVDTPNFKPSETSPEADGKRHVDVKVENIEVDHDALSKSGSGYIPKTVVISDRYVSAMEKGSSNGDADGEEWTEAKKYEMQRVLGRLQQITIDQVETSRPQAELPSQASASPRASGSQSISEWERLARERSTQEQAILKEERENLGVILGKLDSTVAMTVKKNLELYSSALAQMRQDGIELRRLIDEARLRADEDQRIQTVLTSQAATMAIKQTMVINSMTKEGILLSSHEESLSKLLVQMARDRDRSSDFSQKSDLQDSRSAPATGTWVNVASSTRSSLVSVLQRHYDLLKVSMGAKISSLEQKVAGLTKQEARAVTQRSGGYTYDERGIPFERQTLSEVYLIGGLGDQLSRLESVMVWSPATDKLRTAASMLTPRCCAGATVLNEHIYVFGGGDGSSWYDTVERYDRSLNEWRSCASMKTQRGSLGGVTVGERIYAVGGGNGMASFSEVECFDPHLGAWLPCTSMLEKRFCVAAAEMGGVLYALGGFDGEQYLMSVERFDPREALWSRLPSMSVKRGSLSAAVLNGRIYALGGYDGDGILDVVETFDPRAGRWDTGPRMCCRRAYGAVAVVSDALYYLGGLSEDEAVDPEQRSTDLQNGFHEDEAGKDGEDIQRFTEYAGWQSVQPCIIGKRSCLAAVVF